VDNGTDTTASDDQHRTSLPKPRFSVGIAWFIVVGMLIAYMATVDRTLKRDINHLGRVSCENYVDETLPRYTALIDALVEDYTARQLENERRGDREKAAINAKTIVKLQTAYIVANREDCERPILP
jgi:hypothetical protein